VRYVCPMGQFRIASLVVSAGLAVSACSGASQVDLSGQDPGSTGSEKDATTNVPSGADGSSQVATDTGVPDDLGGDGAVDDSTVPDASTGGADGASDGPGDGDDASAGDSAPPPADAGGGDAATFACGPTKHCLEATQYCDITSASVGPVGPALPVVSLDGGTGIVSSPVYSCVTMPKCVAVDKCGCLAVSVKCTCTDTGDGVTDDCTGGIVPLL
jgi:hypothetical protein